MIPDIIDNNKVKLKDAVNTLLQNSILSKMAVGYFYLSGFNNIKENLGKIKSLKLLMGNSTNQETLDELAQGFLRLELAREYKEKKLDYINPDTNKEIIQKTKLKYQELLENVEQTDSEESGIITLANLIEQGKIQAKVYTKGKLHSKAYLFEYENNQVDKGLAIVGSSNLSYSGINHNSELNIVVRGEKNFNEINDWFDRLWDEAKDFDETLLNVIKNSWVFNIVTPYEIYLKVLYHLAKDRIEIDTSVTILDEMNLPPLYDFQKSAFYRSLKILERYDGVFISDVVGLGKSFIGSAILKYYRETKGERALIICPASLVKMWDGDEKEDGYNQKYELGAKVLSMGQLTYPEDKKGNKITNYTLLDEEYLENCSLVLIDESHNFRNNNTERYKIIAPYLQNKKVILLTATPQNKTIWDIYQQIKLFHPFEKTNIPIFPNELKKFFKACEDNPPEVSSLLQHILIRRKRKDIINSPHYTLSLDEKKLTFPPRKLVTIDYSIEKIYQKGLYKQIKCAISCPPQKDKRKECPCYELVCNGILPLTYSRYGLYDYLTESGKKKKVYEGLARAGNKLKGLMKVLLFKRLESSISAFDATLNRMINFHKAFKVGLEKGIFISGRESQEEILGYGDDVYNEELYDFLEQINARYDIGDFYADTLKNDIENDLKVLEYLQQLISPILKQGLDDKLLKLIDNLNQLKAQKILIFTEYEETAKYLFGKIKTEFNYRNVEIAYSEKENIDNIVRRFAPKANTPNRRLKEYEEEIDILISTDVLAEGQNLQDASVVINYDIHWNPVRLIQRIGRIDRIGSEADKIYVYNFLPETEIEKELSLQQRVHNRIQEIHDILGEDDKILTDREVLNEKSMYDIYEGKEDILDSDVQDRLTALDEAERIILELKTNNPEYFEHIKNIPDGVRSAMLKENYNGRFVFCESKDLQKLYFLKDDGIITTDINAIIKTIQCPIDTPTQKLPKDYNININKIFKDFETEVRIYQSEKEKKKTLSKSQGYVRKELNLYFKGLTDLKEREKVELLEWIFLSDLPHYVISCLHILKRDKVVGGQLVNKLIEIYNTFNLSQIIKDVEDRRKKEGLNARIICSEAII